MDGILEVVGAVVGKLALCVGVVYVIVVVLS
jgi:hypothetical protein